MLSKDKSNETPLAIAVREGNVGDVQSLLQAGAAESVFVKGSSARSIFCTLPNARKPTSSVVSHPEPVSSVSPAVIRILDEGVAKFINSKGHGGDTQIFGDEDDNKNPASIPDPSSSDPDSTTVKTDLFRVGDLVRLRADVSTSSLVKFPEVCTVEQSEVGEITTHIFYFKKSFFNSIRSIQCRLA